MPNREDLSPDVSDASGRRSVVAWVWGHPYLVGFAVSLGSPGPVGVPASILAALVGAVLLSRLARSVPGRSPA